MCWIRYRLRSFLFAASFKSDRDMANGTPVHMTELLEQRLLLSGGELFVLSGGTIGAYTTAGAIINANLITLPYDAGSIAVSGSDIFVTNPLDGAIAEYTTSGALVNATLVSGLGGPDAITVVGSDLFVVNSNTATIGEYTTSGATVGTPGGAFMDAFSMTSNGSDFFVTGSDRIQEYNTSFTDVGGVTAPLLNSPEGMAVDGSDLFVTDNTDGLVGEYNYSTGATVTTSLISGLDHPFGIATSGSDLFVSNESAGTIGEYTTSGAPVNTSLISGLDLPTTVALSTDTSPPPTVQKGNLSISTGPGNNSVSVTESGGKVIVTQDGVKSTFSTTSLNGLILSAGSGNDTLQVGSKVTLPATLLGGSGPDQLYGGGGPTLFVDGGVASGGVVEGGSGFAIAQGNPAVSFKGIGLFYDLPSNSGALPVSPSVTIERAQVVVANVSLSGLFIGKLKTIGYQLTLHLLKGSTTHFAGTLYEGSTVYSVRAQFNPQSSLTAILGTFTIGGKTKHFTASISGSEMTLLLGGVGIVLKKYRPMGEASIDGTVLVVQGTNASEQINVSQIGTELTVNATSKKVTQQLGTFSAAGLGPQGVSGEGDHPAVEVLAGSGNDTLALDATNGLDPVILPSILYAGSGNDVLEGEVGSKSASANDEFVSGTGDDTLVGGSGPDSIADYTNHAEAVSVNLLDQVAYKGSGQKDVLKGITSVIGGSGEETLKGGAGPTGLFAGTGQDLLEGSSGTTNLIAANANHGNFVDTLVGGGGVTGFFMGDGYREDYQNYNSTTDPVFSGDQLIDFDLNTNTLLGE